MKEVKILRFVKNLSDVLFNAFGLGMCFSLGALIVSDRPFRSFACILVCMIMTCAMALLYCRAESMLKEFNLPAETERRRSA